MPSQEAVKQEAKHEEAKLVIVAGASGRIGRVTIRQLTKAGYTVVGLDIMTPAFSMPGFEFIKTDLTTDESVASAMQHIKQKYGTKIASVVHLAAYYNFTGGEWESYEKITIGGTHRLLQAVKEFHTEQFLFSSTMLVHAPCNPPERITEESPLTMNWEYPKSKVLTEDLLKKEHGSIPLVILQIAGCYDDMCHSIPISNQIQRIYEGQLEARLFPGNITHGSSFLHLEDMAQAIFLCVEKRKSIGKETTFLVGEEVTMSYDELQREISKLLFGKEIRTYKIPKSCAKVGAYLQDNIPFKKGASFIKPWMIDLADNNYTLDISLIKKATGFYPQHSLAQTLPIMIQALKSDPEKWYQENDLKMPKKMWKK